MVKAAAYNCEALQDPVIFNQVYNIISPQRRAHVDEAKNPKTRCERLGATHLLEKMLWENHLERPYEYTYNESGRPLLVRPEGMQFSISHSDFLAVCAISDGPVGIDVERQRQYDSSMVHRFFTKFDIEFLDGTKEEDQARKFTEVWTFKEAVAKMMDRPLMQVLQWVDFDEYCDCSKGEINWTKQGFEFQDFYITLCYEQKRQPVQMGLYNPFDGKYY